MEDGMKAAFGPMVSVVLLVSGWQAAVATDVTWTGEGATPEWNVAGNWDPGAPAIGTPGRVTFSTAGQAVVSVMETSRSVNELFAGHSLTTESCTHTINLGGHLLVVTNRLRSVSGYQSRRNTLNFTNGTLRVGTAAAPTHIDIYAAGTLRLQPGTLLHPVNIGIVDLRANPYAGSILDLSGAHVAGGELAMQRLLMPGNGWYGTQFLLDDTTQITALTVTERLWLARANVNNNTRQYIGNPADTFTFDGTTGFGRFPAGIDLKLGVSVSEPASVWIAEDTGGHSRSRGVIRVAPGGGGTVTAYLSELKIGMRAGTGVRRPRGLLDLSEMDSGLLSADVLDIAPGRPDAPSTDDERGELHLPPGTATIGTATLGADGGVGFGRLVLKETTFTVTNALSLRKTGEVTLNVGATPTGLDIDQGFSDEGGTIHVNFTAQPSVDTNWAVRIKGDAADALNLMIGQDRLTRTIDESITGRRTGIVADDTYTYFALVDENLVFDPVAIAKDVTFEIGPDNLVLVAPSDVDDGSFDPDDLDTPPQLRLVYDGGPQTNVLEFTSTGVYPVTLVVNILDEEDEVAASATADATVTVVAPPAGTQDNVEWIGDAGTVLMPDRPEWFWSGNWAGGEPPANPTAGTIIYRTQGQSVNSRLAADREVFRLDAGQGDFATNHTIDLDDRTLTIRDRLRLISGGWDRHTRLTFADGTLQLGDTESSADVSLGTGAILTLGTGVKLDAANVGTISMSPGNIRDVVLDLRGAEIVGGVLRAGTLNMPVSAWRVSWIFLDGDTVLDRIEVLNALTLGSGGHAQTLHGFIGDPGDPFNMGGVTIGRFPAGIGLTVGTSTTARASMVVANCSSEPVTGAGIVVAPGGGGSFTGYLTSLGIGLRSGSGSRQPYGILDAAAMDSCLLDMNTLTIAPGRGLDAESTDNERGELHLPPGTATVGTATIGAPDGVGHGLLSLSNTVVTVTNALTLNKTADIRIKVGATASGLALTHADPGTLSLDPEASLTVSFLEAPASPGLHYGLRLPGDQSALLNGMIGTGRLTIESPGLARPAIVFVAQGETYVGVPPPPGSLFLLR